MFEAKRMQWAVGILSQMCSNKHWIWHQWQWPYILSLGKDKEKTKRLPWGHICCLGFRPSMYQDKKWLEFLSLSSWHSCKLFFLCLQHTGGIQTPRVSFPQVCNFLCACRLPRRQCASYLRPWFCFHLINSGASALSTTSMQLRQILSNQCLRH